MLDWVALFIVVWAALMAIVNLKTYNRLIDSIKQTDKARSNMERERQMYEKMRVECELARDSYDTRLATLNNAEKIAEMLSGKGENNA